MKQRLLLGGYTRHAVPVSTQVRLTILKDIWPRPPH